MENGISYAQSFFKVLTQPKETMRSLVDNDPGYGRWALIPIYCLLAGVNADLYAVCREYLGLPPLTAILAAILMMMLAGMVFYWFAASVVFIIGKWLGGTGTLKDVATAYAWAYVPCFAAIILSQVSQIPKWTMILGGETDFMMIKATGRLLGLAVALFNFAFFAWSWVLIAFGVSEAHRISLGRGFGVVGIFLGLLILAGILIGVVLVFLVLGSMRM